MKKSSAGLQMTFFLILTGIWAYEARHAASFIWSCKSSSCIEHQAWWAYLYLSQALLAFVMSLCFASYGLSMDMRKIAKWILLISSSLAGICFLRWAFQSEAYSAQGTSPMAVVYGVRATFLWPLSFLFFASGIIFFIWLRGTPLPMRLINLRILLYAVLAAGILFAVIGPWLKMGFLTALALLLLAVFLSCWITDYKDNLHSGCNNLLPKHRDDSRQDMIVIAKQAFSEIQGRFPQLQVEEDKSVPFDLSIAYPVQPGLKHKVNLFLYGDELYFSVSQFTLEWFPCTKPERVKYFIEAVCGFLSGELRILETYTGDKCIKAELQFLKDGNWKTMGTYLNDLILIGAKRSSVVIRNA